MGGLLAGILAGVAAWLWRGRAPLPPGERASREGADRGHAAAAVDGAPVAGTAVSAAQVVEVAEQLAAALDAGLPLPVAWSHVVGEDPVDAVLVAADGAGRAALLSVRAALRLSEAQGVPAAAVLRAAAVSIRDRLDAEAARRAATSGPVAAAWIVAGLPVIGPLLGAALGIDPVGVLTQTMWGRLCGAAGVSFLVVGALWSRQLVVRARARDS